MTITGFIRRLHLWSGVVLGIQVFLWMLSGVVMSVYHIDLVRGARNTPAPVIQTLNVNDYVSPNEILAKTDDASEIILRHFMGRPVFETRSASGAAIFDALTGERLSPIGVDDIRIIAHNGFVGDGDLVRVQLVDDPGPEMRHIGPRPLWRADFDDRLNTKIYLSPETGDILRRRNDVWRFYDFFWMLHIMDYENRDDFNNPLLRIAAVAGLLFAASGIVMLFFRRSRSALVHDIKKISGRGKKS